MYGLLFFKKGMNLTPVKSKKYKNVYYYDLKGDKKYFFRYKKDRKVYKKIVGLKSEGVTEKFCYQQIATKELKEYSLNEFALKYFESRSLYVSSIGKLKKCYQNKIQDSLGKMNISDINRAKIESWQKEMLEKHNMSKSYINWHTMLMSAIVNYGVNTGLYKGVNPFLKCKFSNCEGIRERFLSKDEIALLLNNLQSDKTLYTFVLIALSTGARLQSILNIRKKDVNLSQSYINIRDTKNSSTYKAFFAEELATLLKETCNSSNDPNSYILKEKTALHYKITVKLKKILDELFNKNLDKKDSVNRVVIHTFRHTFASHLAIQGVPIIKIQALLNHKNIQMTMRYAKLAPDAGKSEAIELARGFFAS
jgi:integrase